MARVGYDLTYLYHEYLAFAAVLGEPAALFQPANSLLQVADGRVAVEVLPSGDAAAIRVPLESLGFVTTAQSTYSLSGFLPITSLDDVAALSGIRTASPAYGPVSSVGLVDSQGNPAQRSDLLARFLGLDGSGVTVGVLSDSYNVLGGADSDIASGDLPGPANPFGLTTPVNVLAEGLDGDSDEGRAMLQIVHDVAPGANLAFATAGLNQTQLASNIFALANHGADIIVDDVTFPAEPMFQDGIVAQAVNDVVATGISYFSAAGNLGRNSYEEVYRNSGVNLGTGPGGTGLVSTSASFIAHDFDPGPGVDLFQTVTLPAGTTIFSFQWADPFFSVSGGAGAQSDLDIAVFDMQGNFLSSVGGFTSNIGGDPVEVFSIDAGASGGQYQLAIGKFSGPDPGRIKYVAFRPEFVADEYATQSSTVFGHANAAGAASVGAVAYNQTPAFGVSPPILESFSSRGGTQILFDTAGNAISPVTRQAVRFVAPDGANTTFFGTTDIEPDGFPNFIGTSAAAPHAAGLAALMLQANRGLTPAQIYDALSKTAIDMGPAGFDRDSGFGLVQGPPVVFEVGGPFDVTFDGTDGNDSLLVRRDTAGNVEFILNGVLQFAIPTTEIASIKVNGLAGTDLLTVDEVNGDPVPTGGLAYVGGESTGDNDRLTVTGYDVASLAVTHTGAESGTIGFGPGAPLISFAQSEAITLAGTAADLAINLPTVFDPDVAIGDDGGPLDPDGTSPTAGYSTIDGSTFAFTQFASPTNGLTVHLGSGGSSVAVRSMDDAFAPVGPAPFAIVSGGSDLITLLGGGGEAFALTATPAGADVERTAGGTTQRLSLIGIQLVAVEGRDPTSGDSLAVTAGRANVVFGNMPGSGTILALPTGSVVPLAVNYRNLGTPSVAAGVVTVSGTMENDVIQVTTAGVVSVTGAGGASGAVAVTAGELDIDPVDGMDQIFVPGNHPFTSVFVSDGVAGSDTLVVSGSGGAMAIDLQARIVGEAGNGVIFFGEIGLLAADAGTGPLTVATGPGFTKVSPTGNSLDILSGPVLVRLPASSNFTILGTSGPDDVLSVQVPTGAGLFRVPGDGTIDLGGFATIGYDQGIDSLEVSGTTGDDTFEVAPGPIPIRVDGESQSDGDRLVFAGSLAFVPTPGDGTIPSNLPIDYRSIELFTMGSVPAAAPDSSTTSEETAIVLDVLANDADLDDGPFTISIDTPPMFGTAAIVDGKILYTPIAGYNSAIAGTDSLTYRVTDANGDASTATVTISITAVNERPTADSQIRTITEDTTVAIRLTGQDNDPEVHQALTFAIVAAPTHGTLSGFNPTTGDVTYTPFANYSGPDSFSFTVTDDTAAGMPAKTSTPGTIFIQVASANDPPTAIPDHYTVTEDEMLRVGGSGVLANDSDQDGDPLAIALVAGPAHGTLSLNPSGSFSYVPMWDFAGIDSFEYRVSDGRGGSSTATVSIAVTPVRDDIIVTGAGDGGGPHVMVFDARSGAPKFSFFAYDESYRGGVRVAVGDVNGDGIDDIITGTGPGGFPHVKVFSGRDLTELASFFAFDEAFEGGISIAAGDLDGLPGDEVVVSAGPGSGPHVRSFKIINGQAVPLAGPLGSFFAYDASFTGGVNVTVGNYDGQPGDEIIVGAASLGGPHIKVFSTTGVLASFFAFPQSSLGVSVAAGDIDGDGRAEIITGPAVGGGPVVRVFQGGTAAMLAEFPAFDPDFRGGITVGSVDRDRDGRDDLLVAPAEESRSLQVFDGDNFSLFEEFNAFDSAFPGGVFVGGKSRSMA